MNVWSFVCRRKRTTDVIQSMMMQDKHVHAPRGTCWDQALSSGLKAVSKFYRPFIGMRETQLLGVYTVLTSVYVCI